MSVFGCGCCNDDIATSEKLRKLEKIVNGHTDTIEELGDKIDAFTTDSHIHPYPTNGEGRAERWIVHTDEEFQTCMDRVNKGATDMRIYIDTPGNFFLKAFAVQFCCLHITARVGGVVITIGDDTDANFAFYHCHLNFQGVSDNEPITFRMLNPNRYTYFEGCTTLFQYVNFNFTCGSWGGYVAYRHCDFTKASEADRDDGKRCMFSVGSKIIMQACHFADKRDKVTLIHLESTDINIYGVTTVDLPESVQEKGFGFWAVRSSINLTAVMHMERRKWGMYADNCILNVNNGRMNALKESVEGVELKDCCNIWGLGMN